MHSVKKSLPLDNKENDERTSDEQVEFQRLLKGLSKRNQETRKAEKRHKYFLSPREQKREKRSAAAKKKKHRK